MPKQEQVENWLENYDNPMKPVVLRIREIILNSDSRIDECIKWKAPTFIYKGNLASFYPRSKKHASLMFHQGAKIPGTHALLEGDGSTSRVMKLGSIEEVDKSKQDIEKLVQAWCKWKDGE